MPCISDLICCRKDEMRMKTSKSARMPDRNNRLHMHEVVWGSDRAALQTCKTLFARILFRLYQHEGEGDPAIDAQDGTVLGEDGDRRVRVNP